MIFYTTSSGEGGGGGYFLNAHEHFQTQNPYPEAVAKRDLTNCSHVPLNWANTTCTKIIHVYNEIANFIESCDLDFDTNEPSNFTGIMLVVGVTVVMLRSGLLYTRGYLMVEIDNLFYCDVGEISDLSLSEALSLVNCNEIRYSVKKILSIKLIFLYQKHLNWTCNLSTNQCFLINMWSQCTCIILIRYIVDFFLLYILQKYLIFCKIFTEAYCQDLVTSLWRHSGYWFPIHAL